MTNKDYRHDKQRRHRAARQKWIVEVKEHYGCRLCKEKNIFCLTFHHYDRGEKDHKVCKAKSNFSKAVLREELNKCVVLCLNCHAKVENGVLNVSKDMICKISETFKMS